MDGYTIYSDPALRGKTPWPVIESSLWLRVGFVAFAVAVIALTELYKGEANPLAAIAWIFVLRPPRERPIACFCSPLFCRPMPSGAP